MEINSIVSVVCQQRTLIRCCLVHIAANIDSSFAQCYCVIWANVIYSTIRAARVYLPIIALSRLTIRISRTNNKWFPTCEYLCKRFGGKAIPNILLCVFSLAHVSDCEGGCLRPCAQCTHSARYLWREKNKSGLNVYVMNTRSCIWCKMQNKLQKFFVRYRRTQHNRVNSNNNDDDGVWEPDARMQNNNNSSFFYLSSHAHHFENKLRQFGLNWIEFNSICGRVSSTFLDGF